jgi:hypothetical protein
MCWLLRFVVPHLWQIAALTQSLHLAASSPFTPTLFPTLKAPKLTLTDLFRTRSPLNDGQPSPRSHEVSTLTFASFISVFVF